MDNNLAFSFIIVGVLNVGYDLFNVQPNWAAGLILIVIPFVYVTVEGIIRRNNG